jgi:hypothetical protein
VCVFYNSGKDLKDDSGQFLIVKKEPKLRRRGLNEKKTFSDIAAANHSWVNGD